EAGHGALSGVGEGLADVVFELSKGRGRAQPGDVGDDAFARLGDVFFQPVEFERGHQPPVLDRNGSAEPADWLRVKLSLVSSARSRSLSSALRRISSPVRAARSMKSRPAAPAAPTRASLAGPSVRRSTSVVGNSAATAAPVASPSAAISS